MSLKISILLTNSILCNREFSNEKQGTFAVMAQLPTRDSLVMGGRPSTALAAGVIGALSPSAGGESFIESGGARGGHPDETP
jgi:hypothetical protein